MSAGTGRDERTCEVLIIGGGPTGLLLACLLAQRGVEVVVLERRERPHAHSRAIGLHPPALRALDAVGLSEAAVAEGARIGAGQARADGRVLGTVSFEKAWPDRPFVLALPQTRTEALLAGRLAELAPGALRRGRHVHDLEDLGGAARVHARRADGGLESWRSRVVVGADGARSAVRELTGVGSRLHRYPDSYLMGDVAGPGLEAGTAMIHLEAAGVVESFPLPGGRRRWVVHTGIASDRTTVAGGGPATAAPSEVPNAEPSGVPAARAGAPAELAETVARRTGARIDPSTCTMISAFRVRRRTVRRMVVDRVVLIGDAAHEISPIGGQGMTLGWLDALMLAPLLEDAVHLGLRGSLRQLPGMRRLESRRLAAARRAGRVAGVNMALGRPLPTPPAAARNLLLAAALGTPLRHGLAKAYSMSWSWRRR